jgi:hypothetical protein
VEDPAEGFQRLRDVVDIEWFLRNNANLASNLASNCNDSDRNGGSNNTESNGGSIGGSSGGNSGGSDANRVFGGGPLLPIGTLAAELFSSDAKYIQFTAQSLKITKGQSEFVVDALQYLFISRRAIATIAAAAAAANANANKTEGVNDTDTPTQTPTHEQQATALSATATTTTTTSSSSVTTTTPSPPPPPPTTTTATIATPTVTHVPDMKTWRLGLKRKLLKKHPELKLLSKSEMQEELEVNKLFFLLMLFLLI